LRDSAVIRWLEGELVWYPPGSSAPPRRLSDEAELEQLRSIVAARRAPLIYAAPGADVTLRELGFTAQEKRHIGKSLPFLLEDEFAADIDTLHFASRPLGKLRMGVAVCEHERMVEWQEALSGLPATNQWIPEPLLLPWQPGELCIVFEGADIVARHGLCSGFTVERALAGPVLEALAVDPAIASVIVYGEQQERDVELLPAALREKMQWRTGDFSAALMLAEEDRHALNLRQGAYGAKLPLDIWWRQWRVAAALFGLAFALQLAATYAEYSALKADNLVLRQQIETAYRTAVPQGAVVDPEKQLQRQLDTLRGGGSGAGFLSLMERIGRVIQSESGAQLASINFNDKTGDVRLNLVVPDFRAVESIRTRLGATGLSAEMENSNAQGSAVRARFRVSEK